MVVTDSGDWGGWRVPGAEYDRDPRKIELQARLIASPPALRRSPATLLALVAEAPDDAPAPMQDLAQRAVAIDRGLSEMPTAPDAELADDGSAQAAE